MCNQLRELIGHATEPTRVIVERDHVRRFAEAIGDRNPLWVTQAPPTFLVALVPGPEDVPEIAKTAERYGTNWLNGGNRFEYGRALKVGDQLVVTGVLMEVSVKKGSHGHLLIIVFKTDFSDDTGLAVARLFATAIRL